jgi:two-component system, chemotaxis family, chemotaxis protein CheY
MEKQDKLVFLVVDDSKISRKWLIEMIPPKILENATIIEGTNGEEGVVLYEEHRPDIVFMDITMPVVDGLEALVLIKKINPEAVVVMVSADRQKSTQANVLSLGARAVLSKPVDGNDFRAILLDLIS